MKAENVTKKSREIGEAREAVIKTAKDFINAKMTSYWTLKDAVRELERLEKKYGVKR